MKYADLLSIVATSTEYARTTLDAIKGSINSYLREKKETPELEVTEENIEECIRWATRHLASDVVFRNRFIKVFGSFIHIIPPKVRIKPADIESNPDLLFSKQD